METELEAVNGRRVRAIEVFAHALRFFREHALKVHLTTPVCDSRMVWKYFASKDVAVLSLKVCWADHILHLFFVFHSAPGGEGSVIISVGRRGDQMGDHCPGCMETTSQTVHERGSVLGRNTHNETQAWFCYFKSKFMYIANAIYKQKSLTDSILVRMVIESHYAYVIGKRCRKKSMR